MSTNQPQPMMTQAQAAEMLRLQRRADRRGGCLFGIVMTLLFGVFYWAWLALKWTVQGTVVLIRLSWSASIVCWRWTWRGCVATWHWSQMAWPHIVRYARAFHARYGARGWAIAGAVAAAVCVVGAVASR